MFFILLPGIADIINDVFTDPEAEAEDNPQSKLQSRRTSDMIIKRMYYRGFGFLSFSAGNYRRIPWTSKLE